MLLMLWYDRKQASEFSIALWIPTIWMLIIASKPLGIWFNPTGVVIDGGSTLEEGSPFDRIFLFSLLGLGLITLLKRRFNWSAGIKENKWLILLIGYMLVSILWSEMPYVSLKRWAREFIALIMAFVITTETNPRKALESLFRRVIYILIPLSYVLIHYYAEYGRLYLHREGKLMWIGATLHKNQLAQLCLFASFYLIWTFSKRWKGRSPSAARYQTFFELCILILAFWLMGGPQHSLTYSATTTGAFVAGLSIFSVLSWMKKHGTVAGPTAFMAFIAFIIIYGTITPMVGKLSLIDVSSLLGREETLTGRTEVWAQLVPAAMSRPLFGFGFGGFWTTLNRAVYDISDAHNGYLGMTLELGFFGILFFSFFILSAMRKARKEMSRDFDWACLWICYISMTVIHNITESSLNTFTTRLMAILLLLSISSTKSDAQVGNRFSKRLR